LAESGLPHGKPKIDIKSIRWQARTSGVLTAFGQQRAFFLGSNQ
jgi:hypothetical protein